MTDRERRGTRRAGPFWALLSLLLLVVVLLLLRERVFSPLGVVQPEIADPEQTVEALVAEIRGADGSILQARITPLHADPERQAFERRTLSERLDLGEGEPWRLSLEWRRGRTDEGAGGQGSAAGRFTGDGPARGEPLAAPVAALGLGAVRVEDSQGAALESLPVPAAAAATGAADPLRTLLAPPGGSLGEGQAVSWVLWGRRPLAGARVEGLLPPEGAQGTEEFVAATGLRGPLTFEDRSVARRELLLPLARLERDLGGDLARGKNQGSGSSEEP